jgi:hypothetical protein
MVSVVEAMVLSGRQTAGFRTGLRRWFLRNLLKPADCRRPPAPESVGSGSLLCAALPNPRPTLARPSVGNRFAPFRDAESEGHRQQAETRHELMSSYAISASANVFLFTVNPGLFDAAMRLKNPHDLIAMPLHGWRLCWDAQRR